MGDEQLNNLRHTLAHLLAQAVLGMHPDAKLTIGPTTEDGFYYDFDNVTIREEDLPVLEKSMREIASRNVEMRHEMWPIEKARDYFDKQGATYKLELIDELAASGETEVGIAFTGEEFTDLCRGGHIKNTKDIPLDAFKLSRVAGAYWRGDESKPMLTRVYGIAFETKKELEEYEAKIEEAKNRDHRKLGAELDLFAFSDLVGAGLPLWTPRGTALRDALLDFLWELSKKRGYQKVAIPHITKLDLYETSGHADKFRDEFFYVHGAQSGQDFVMKPMNCPHHTQIYASRGRSYRDLPLRYTETTVQYRDEKPGELLGLSRVRAITIDDAHTFCRPDQIKQEVSGIVEIIKEFYSALGMWNKGETFWVSLSVRDPEHPEKYLGSDANWELAERTLEEVAKEYGLDAPRKEGEAAFYGPKLDFMFADALGRQWQLATAQIDFVQPERFGLEYTDENGDKQTPVMVHRAISGSLERFLSVLIEHYAGSFPTWLAPEQVWVLPVSDKYNEYAMKVAAQLADEDVRVAVRDENESLGKKIRTGTTQKIPYLLIVGEKEEKDDTVSVRSYREGEVGTLKIDECVERIEEEIEERRAG